MAEVEQSTSKVSYVLYRDGDPSHGSEENSADSDSASYYSSASEDETTEKQVQMKSFANGNSSAKRIPKWLRPEGRKLKMLEITLMTIAIVIVLGIYSLPVSFYINESSPEQEQQTANTTSSNDVPAMINTSCEGLTSGVSPSLVCSPEPYAGGDICGNYLLSWKNCTLGDADVPLTVSLSESLQSDAENEAQLFFNLLGTFGQSTSTECEALASSFVCLYLFPLCDEQGKQYLPSRELCLKVSMDVCRVEWATAQLFDQDNMLPDCADLPNATSNDSVTNSSNITCNSMFTPIDGICIPDCYKFFTGSPKQLENDSIILVVTATFGLLTSIVLFVASFWRRKIMWRFPYVFLLYVTIEYSILAIFLLISLADRGLFCRNISLVESTMNPTTYCTITGILGHYFLISMAYFWFFHVCSTFYKVMFPHLAKRTESKQRFIHAVLALLALVLPLPPVIVVLSDRDYEYFVSSYPPYVCISKDTKYVLPISMLLVLNFLMAIGTSLFVPMLWAIHKHRRTLFTSRRKKRWRISVVGRKLILTLGYFVVFGTMSLIFLAVVVAEQDHTEEIIHDLILCEAPGLNVNPNCTSNLTDLTKHNVLATATFTLMGMLPLVILLFTVNWKLAGKKTKAFLTKLGLALGQPKQNPGVVVFSSYSPFSSTIPNK